MRSPQHKAAVQSAKEPPNRQNVILYREIRTTVGTGHCPVLMTQGIDKPCFARHFDLLHKSNSTVPMYADKFDLFVFEASLTSDILSKTSF